MLCDKTFRSDKSLRTHEIIHWRKNLKSSDIFNFTSSFNHQQLYINRLDQVYTTDNNEAANNGLDNNIPYKSHKYKGNSNSLRKNRTTVANKDW